MLLWALLPAKMSSVRPPIPVISSSSSADVPDVTAAAVLPDPPRYIPIPPSRPVVPRYKRVMHLPSVRFRDCSAERKSAV